MREFLKPVLLASAFGAVASMAVAQESNLAFGGMAIDADAPVEMSADQLSVNQADGTAIFSGNVRVAQGDLKMTAGEMRIEYSEETEGQDRRISRLIASGGVTLVTPTEAAEAAEAVYSIEDGTISMSGSVLLTQGPNAISGDKLTIDLESGAGNIEGRVRTTLQSGGSN